MTAVEFTEDLFRCDVTKTSWDLIVNISSILHCHRPKRRIIGIRPSEGSMEHNGSGSMGDSLDSSL